MLLIKNVLKSQCATPVRRISMHGEMWMDLGYVYRAEWTRIVFTVLPAETRMEAPFYSKTSSESITFELNIEREHHF